MIINYLYYVKTYKPHSLLQLNFWTNGTSSLCPFFGGCPLLGSCRFLLVWLKSDYSVTYWNRNDCKHNIGSEVNWRQSTCAFMKWGLSCVSIFQMNNRWTDGQGFTPMSPTIDGHLPKHYYNSLFVGPQFCDNWAIIKVTVFFYSTSIAGTDLHTSYPSMAWNVRTLVTFEASDDLRSVWKPLFVHSKVVRLPIEMWPCKDEYTETLFNV